MFTNKEKKLIYNPYFKVIREEEQFIEVLSVCTGHCWNIFKNQFEAKPKVTLYHKHKQSDAYYHQHWICRNVNHAIEEIKQHDDYVIEQEKKKANTSQAELLRTKRKLKVYERSGYQYKPTPAIQLKGEYLKEWGFDIGSEINVVCDGFGKMTITRAEI